MIVYDLQIYRFMGKDNIKDKIMILYQYIFYRYKDIFEKFLKKMVYLVYSIEG